MPKILCAEDADDIRALITTVLARTGVEVVTATTGAEALEMMVHERPDAVVLDIAMPIIDGLEVLRRMAGDPALARIPVMMLTSYSQIENVQEALAYGASDFVVKPFEPQALRERVRRLLGVRKQMGVGQVQATINGNMSAPPELRVARKVLVVEDQPAMLAMAREILSDRFEVVTAQSGAGALSVAQRERPDVILMDLFMPVMDGVEAVRRLREMPEVATTRVLAMTLGTAEEERYLEEFDGAIRKPLQRHDVLGAISAAIGDLGPFSFIVSGELTVLRIHETRLREDDPRQSQLALPEPGIRNRFWTPADIHALQEQCERAFARMLENGDTWFVIALENLSGLTDRQMALMVSTVRNVAVRSLECSLDCKLVIPFWLQRYFNPLRDELKIEVCWRMGEALRSLKRQSARRTAKPRPVRAAR